MHWFPVRTDQCKKILGSQGVAAERFVVIPITKFNAANVFITGDLYQASLNCGFTPIILPPITEQFTEQFCSYIWQMFSNDQALIGAFIQKQTSFRAGILQAEIEKDASRIPDIGLYDAFQLLEISKRKVVLLAEGLDALFEKAASPVLLGLEYFLTTSPGSLLVGSGDFDGNRRSKLAKMQLCKIHPLDDINVSDLVSHGLRAAKLVSPHLNFSFQEAIEYCKQCQAAEEFISGLQIMVLHQQPHFEESARGKSFLV